MRKILLLVLSLFTSITLAQETVTTAQSGDWDQPATWSGNSVPSNGDNIIVDTNHTLTLNVSGVSIRSVVINNDGNFNIDQDLTISGLSNSSVQGNMVVRSTVTVSAGDFEIKASNFGAGLSAGNISINSGDQLIFSDSNSSFAINGNLVINSDSENFGAVLFKGTASYNDFNVTYNRFITGITTTGNSNWNTISSPAKSVSASGITLQSNLAQNGAGGDYGIGDYDNTTGADGTWSTWSSTEAGSVGNLTPAKGYQMVTDGTGSTIAFTGTFNDNSLSIEISEGDSAGDAASATGSRWNLLGNPYTGYISVNSNASGASSFGSEYLLTTSALSKLNDDNQAVYVFNGTSYTTIGTSTAAAAAVIAPGQGFMVGGKHDDGSQSISFTSNMMTEDGADDGLSGDIMPDDDRAELFISFNQTDIDRRTEVYFLDSGSDSFTSADAGTIDLEYNGIYSRVVSGENNVNLAIQTLAYSEMWDKVIPLGINALGSEEMTISISHRTTPADLNIYLEDTEEGTMTNLLDGDFIYTPTSDLEGVGRFFIHMTADTMSNGEVSTSMLNAYKEIDASYITIEGLATQTSETKVSLYNILGREVLSTTLNNNMGTQTISTVGLSVGIYVIELESGSDRLTKKLLIQ